MKCLNWLIIITISETIYAQMDQTSLCSSNGSMSKDLYPIVFLIGWGYIMNNIYGVITYNSQRPRNEAWIPRMDLDIPYHAWMISYGSWHP